MARQKRLAPIEVLRTMHRSRDGFIPLARKSEGRVRPYAGLPVSTLDEWFPSIVEELTEDGYFAPNTMRKAGRVFRTGYPYPIPCDCNVKYLNANFVDVDCHKLKPEPISWTLALAVVLQYAEENVIPMPSFFARSGRGLYVLWMLRDEADPGIAPVANMKDNREKWRAVETSLIKRLANIGADAVACNEARWLRLPGSIHTGAKNRPRVTYMVLLNDNGEMPLYELPDMLSLMDIQYAPLPPVVPKGFRLPPGKRPKGKGSRVPSRARSPHRLRAREIEILNDMRGGFREGCREVVLWVYSCSLRSAGLDESQVWDECQKLAAKFRPKLPAARFHHAVQRRKRASRWRNSTVARWLAVADDEAEYLSMLVPDPLRKKRERAAERAREKRRVENAYAQLRFLDLRQRGDMSKRAIARELGVSATTILNWERAWPWLKQQEEMRRRVAEHFKAQESPELPL